MLFVAQAFKFELTCLGAVLISSAPQCAYGDRSMGGSLL